MLFLILTTSAFAGEVPRHISGLARIVDGDGLKISEWEIRLFGIGPAPKTVTSPLIGAKMRRWDAS